MTDLKTALNDFLSSDDFKSGVISSTQAGFGGSSYKVELFEDGTYRVLWANQIGNLYNTPGAILTLPQLDAEDLEEIEGWTEEEVQDNAFSIRADEFEQELRRELDFILEQRKEAEEEIKKEERRMGRPPVEERKESQQVMLEPRYIEQVERMARERGMTKSAMMRELLIQALDAQR